ncbi:hypothetical protein [Prevotella sp. E13-27]|uniref:hypothetical protein n=1 Tax=Prevotella sp. E13-27 TaxID=2938122 RepID=UPI00200B2B48|nr:hypothetical protein [Prevotella sp. E13-27]MCK8621046.1 hypothetical protein [Prevotella sp. E13-27]
MKRTILVACCLLGVSIVSSAQNQIRIHYKGGTVSDIPIEEIDSVTFVQKDTPVEEVTLIGSWLWGNQEQGYYELIAFNEDHTYTGYDNYFAYGFDTMTYGWWAQIGAMLTLQSNGFGYQRRYNWYVTELAENALGVMTKMGPFTYYKVQPELLHLQVNGTLECEEGDSLVFADGVIATIQDNKLVGLALGETYIQKYIADSKCIVAYKVVVTI